MDDISKFLLGPGRSSDSSFGLVLPLIAALLAGSLLLCLLRFYIQERRIRKRIEKRVHQPYAGNIVPPEVVFVGADLDDLGRVGKHASAILPPARCDNGAVRHRRRVHGPHPWKQQRSRRESSTPH